MFPISNEIFQRLLFIPSFPPQTRKGFTLLKWNRNESRWLETGKAVSKVQLGALLLNWKTAKPSGWDNEILSTLSTFRVEPRFEEDLLFRKFTRWKWKRPIEPTNYLISPFCHSEEARKWQRWFENSLSFSIKYRILEWNYD